MADHAIKFTVNGQDHSGHAEARKTLADYLREDCGLTGTHLGCEHGVCGACTILVDGEAVRSCLMFAVQAEGAEITTIEGIGPADGSLGPVQEAFRQAHGLQCGFCTPGFVISVHAFLEQNPNPSLDEIREGLSGNLCRCTGYQGIIKAVQIAAETMSAPARVSTVTELSTPDGVMELYEASPDGDPRGAVIVVQEAFGVNDHIQDVTRRFAAAGYHAVAPTLFHRAGGGIAPYDDFTQVMPLFQDVTDDGILADVDATLAHLEARGFDRSTIGIVGFCFGGRVTFLVAARRTLGAAVGFYGGGIAAAGGLPFAPLIGEASSLQTPWLGLFGDLDKGISIESVEELRAALVGAPVATDIVRYPDADHGFHCDARASYHAESAADAWRRALEWFDTHLT